MAEAETPFMGTAAQGSQGLAKAPSGRSTGGGLASPPQSPSGTLKAPAGRLSGSFGANGHPAPVQLSSPGASGVHAQVASPTAAAAQVASPTAAGAQIASPPALGSPLASTGVASPRVTAASASPTPAAATSPEPLAQTPSGKQSEGMPVPATPAAQQAPATPAAQQVPATPAAEPAPAPTPVAEQAPTPTISVKELSKQLASPAPDSGLTSKPSNGSSAGSGRPPVLGRSPSQLGMGAPSPSMTNRRATSPAVAFLATRSEHDKANTTNAVQLLQLGAFKLQPLKDVIPYDDLVKLRLEDGIDPTRKEDYLGPEDFQKVMGMDRDAYTKLPPWKRVDMKKRTFLF